MAINKQCWICGFWCILKGMNLQHLMKRWCQNFSTPDIFRRSLSWLARLTRTTQLSVLLPLQSRMPGSSRALTYIAVGRWSTILSKERYFFNRLHSSVLCDTHVSHVFVTINANRVTVRKEGHQSVNNIDDDPLSLISMDYSIFGISYLRRAKSRQHLDNRHTSLYREGNST